MTDKPTDDQPADEGPITPEVMRRGAAARKRRPAPGAPGGDAPPVPERPVRTATGTLFRVGCLLLVVLGAFELFLASQLVLDPDDARCTAARFRINDANDDDEDFNDVDLPEGDDDADDLPCAEAIELAGQVPDDEDTEPDGEFTEASTFRTQGIFVSALGLAHAAGGFFTLRTRRKAIRTATLVAVAVGIFLPVLGIISMLLLAFAVYALVFSNDAKSIFGQAGGFLRPRPPRASG